MCPISSASSSASYRYRPALGQEQYGRRRSGRRARPDERKRVARHGGKRVSAHGKGFGFGPERTRCTTPCHPELSRCTPSLVIPSEAEGSTLAGLSLQQGRSL